MSVPYDLQIVIYVEFTIEPGTDKSSYHGQAEAAALLPVGITSLREAVCPVR